MLSYILLWLEAPFQSWGWNSKFGPRATECFPTKSGLYGMYLSAMGLRGGQKDFLAAMNPYHQTVFCFTSSLIRNQKSLLVDYQVVGNGFDVEQYSGDKWYSLHIPRKQNGDIPNTGGAKIVFKHYLQDSKFAVIQEVGEDLVGQISEALMNPVYEIFLGRKNCVPSDLVFRGVYDRFEEANVNALRIAKEKGLGLAFTVSETEKKGERIVLNDVPIMFGAEKQYRNREVFLLRQDADSSFTN